MNRGVCRCPACGAEKLELADGFHIPLAYGVELPWNLVTYIHEKVYVKVVCTNCGYRMFHQMMRLGPFDAPPRSVKYIGEPSGGV